MLQLAAGLLGGLGSLFGGGKSKSSESFDKHTDSETTASAQDLSPELLKLLEGMFTETLGSGRFGAAGEAMESRLNQLNAQAAQPQFDVEAFTKGIVGQAVAASGLDLESSINEMLSKGGVTETSNSMSALLGNKLRNQTAANIGGIASAATGEGEKIRIAGQESLTQGIGGLSEGLSNQILAMIQQTRGANMTGTSKTKEHSWGTGTSESKDSGGGFLDGFSKVFGAFSNARGNA